MEIVVKGFGEEIERIVGELGDAPVSPKGFSYLMKLLIEEGAERAVEAAREIRENAPGEEPRMYRSFWSHLPVYRNRECGFTGPIRADYARGAPFDLYRGTIIYLDVSPSESDRLVRNADQVFSFVKKHVNVLSQIPSMAAGRAVLSLIKGEDERAAEICLKSLLRRALSDAIRVLACRGNGVVDCGGLTIARVADRRKEFAAVDLEKMAASRILKIHDLASVLLSKGEKRLRAKHTVSNFHKIFSKKTIEELKKRKPALALLI